MSIPLKRQPGPTVGAGSGQSPLGAANHDLVRLRRSPLALNCPMRARRHGASAGRSTFDSRSSNANRRAPRRLGHTALKTIPTVLLFLTTVRTTVGAMSRENQRHFTALSEYKSV